MIAAHVQYALMPDANIEQVLRYHDGTKHHFHRFARSLGYLDWASQPRPFRAFHGAAVADLRVDEGDPAAAPPSLTYPSLFAADAPIPALPVSRSTLGPFLRFALGLSAWKSFRGSRWALRVNPSSGNLHPTEAYIVTGPLGELGEAGVWHYAPDRHALERRCAFDAGAWPRTGIGEPAEFLVALTSIHWREAWKYGERAFRYCQHDLGHAIAALRLSARICGWRLAILPAWPHQSMAMLVGIDRDADFEEAEREEPACVMVVGRGPSFDRWQPPDRDLLNSVRHGRWSGRASQLSEEHVDWTFIDEVARATEDAGRAEVGQGGMTPFDAVEGRLSADDRTVEARGIVLRRRSAVMFDGESYVDCDRFLAMISRTLPRPAPPWDALWWAPRIHLALFVHRVRDLTPGLYLLARSASAVPGLRSALRSDFSWTPTPAGLPLWLLQAGDCRSLSQRLSCDQEIAADGFFSLAMIGELENSLTEYGASFYRQLFWETGVIGQVLYLEAEAAGARATGIGCFYDDPVHDLLGLSGHRFQSLYHFAVGAPVEDARLTTEPGYTWEAS